MLTWITQGQLLCLRLGRLKDEGRMTPQQVSLAKRANVDMACDIARHDVHSLILGQTVTGISAS